MMVDDAAPISGSLNPAAAAFQQATARKKVIIAGLTLLTSLVLQAVLNMAVVLALVPPKGISLPLISYGGSSLLVSLTSLGMILSFSRAIPEQDELETLPTGETRPAA